MKSTTIAILFFTAFLTNARAEGPQPLPTPSSSTPIAPYLQPGAPAFDMTVSQFREKYNTLNPGLSIPEYRAIENSHEKSHLVRAASKISDNIYSSVALEAGTGKIKTIQLTWLPVAGPEETVAINKAIQYMQALAEYFEPGLNVTSAPGRIDDLLKKSKGSRYFTQNEGTIRYTLVDRGEKGRTFAIEPIKLTLPSN
ncbi:MAG: hypothetical protein XXXJIFNMEKO3_03437 [Candidatus Erwinia impunctatus]|nr:hypothetical protein XXXJIFNMEKO_03437 [Culicoides impunctatus]